MCAHAEQAGLDLRPIGTETSETPASVALQHAIRRLRKILRQRRQLRHLVELDDRLLADVGVTNEEALREAEKSLWP